MWQPVKPNCTISFVSPGTREPILDRLKKTIEYYESLGLKVHVPEGFCTKEHPFHSDEDEARANEFIEALESDSDIIMCYRGGYGSAKVIAQLEKKRYKPKREKILIGFSDITALHIYFHEKYGWQPIHGGVSVSYPEANEPRNTKDVAQTLDIIFGKTKQLNIDDLVCLSENKPTKPISGKLHGGNLCLVQTTIGTSYQANFKDKIVFLEDVSERGYRIDRMLNHLLDAGLFEGARALVYGEIIGGNEPNGKENLVMFSLKDFAKKLDFPVFHSNSFGHGYRNIPLVYGADAKIENEDNKIILNYKLIH